MSEGEQPNGEQASDEQNQAQQADGDEAYFADLTLGEAWGESITTRRAAQLEATLHVWEQEVDHGERKGPFDGRGLTGEEYVRARLTGVDVFWLAARTLARTSQAHAVAAAAEQLRLAPGHAQMVQADLSALNLMGTNLSYANLAAANLSYANLANAILRRANLAGANLDNANLANANLGANLPRASLVKANLAGTFLANANLADAALWGANLAGADLGEVNLTYVFLRGANLAGTSLGKANLAGADLGGANLTSANLSGASLSGADLQGTIFDKRTDLADVVLTDTLHWYSGFVRRFRRERTHGPVMVADIEWNDFTKFTVVDWSVLRRLGDERGERWWWRTRRESERAARANVQLAKRLRDAGMNDDADRFSYRAQVCQRGVHLLRFRLGRWLFSCLLFVIAGYGYRPLRTLFWYLAVIFGFAFIYHAVGPGAGVPLSPLGSLVFSVTSFHGRGFFPGGSPGHSVTLDDQLTVMAAAEAVVGLFIEISFIATFTQRYFGK